MSVPSFKSMLNILLKWRQFYFCCTLPEPISDWTVSPTVTVTSVTVIRSTAAVVHLPHGKLDHLRNIQITRWIEASSKALSDPQLHSANVQHDRPHPIVSEPTQFSLSNRKTQRAIPEFLFSTVFYTVKGSTVFYCRELCSSSQTEWILITTNMKY